MKNVFVFLILFAAFKTQAASPLIRAYKLELSGRDIPEGSLLVEQKYKGQSAYTLSYYIGERTIRTQVLLKKAFESYVNEMKLAVPKVENWSSTTLLRCQSSGLFGSQNLNQKNVKKICFDAVSDRSKAKFSETFEKLKDVAFGRGF